MKTVCICTSSSCRQRGSELLLPLARTLAENTDIQVKTCQCLGACAYGPNVQISDDDAGGPPKRYLTVLPDFLRQLFEKLK